MNAEEYARVKTIFFRAIDLPLEARHSFIQQACKGNAPIEQEVHSLLAHHHSQTLLPALQPTVTLETEAATMAPPTPPLRKVTDEAFESPSLVLSDLWNENREMLQRRLRVFATILGLIVGYSILIKLFQATPLWAAGSRIACLAIDVVCLWYLSRRRVPSLRQLRILELVVTANIVFLMVVSDLREMHLLSDSGDAVAITSASLWNYFTWALLILTYGVFIPNTWQRAALLLLPIACVPYVVDTLMRELHPAIAATLQSDAFGMPLPLPFIAAGIAISAATVIHTARLAAFRARRFAQYELVREIGAGGMGKVYEARHVMLKRPCAIKVIQPERNNDRNLENFEREVRSTSQLTHPHTIEVYDFGQTNEGLFFYVMELLPGANLRDLVNESGPLPAARAVHFLIQICGALEEAHAMGLIHRDIKPGNIFAAERGGIFDFAKLLDFGLVRRIDDEDASSKQTGPVTAGTPAYMSPEQIVDYSNIDARSDVYSLGGVAYFLLTGRPPFQRANDIEILIAHAEDAVVPPVILKPDIGAALSDIVLKCLAKSPEQRFQSARELKAALMACDLDDAWDEQAAKQWWEQRAAVENSTDLL